MLEERSLVLRWKLTKSDTNERYYVDSELDLVSEINDKMHRVCENHT